MATAIPEHLAERIAQAVRALIDGRFEDFAEMFAVGGAVSAVTQGREQDLPGSGRGAAQIVITTQSWVDLTANRVLSGYEGYPFPDKPDTHVGVPEAMYGVVYNFAYAAVMVESGAPVNVLVRGVFELDEALRLTFVQTDQGITRSA